ncbi:MAG: hypothetical protein ACXVCY_08775 [Pseudobdellovibrionaceae bacterium]
MKNKFSGFFLCMLLGTVAHADLASEYVDQQRQQAVHGDIGAIKGCEVDDYAKDSCIIGLTREKLSINQVSVAQIVPQYAFFKLKSGKVIRVYTGVLTDEL